MEKVINIYLVRHGQTYANKFFRFQGWADLPLTEKGLADAKHAGERLANLGFDKAYSSDLKRANDTAKIVLSEHKHLKNMPIKQMAEFREIFFGVFDGLNIGECMQFVNASTEKQCYQDFSAMVQDIGIKKAQNALADADQYKLAEHYEDVWARLQKGLEKIYAENEDGATVLLVIHGAIIQCIVDHFAGAELASAAPLNGSVTKLKLSKDEGIVELYNDVKTKFLNR